MEKLTKAQQRILDRVGIDGALMRCDDGFQFTSGETAHARVVRNLINKGALIDNDDSMFGTPSQTLRAAE